MPLRITYVITGLGFGGAEAQLVGLARGMQQRGWEVRVISLLPLSGLASKLMAHGFEVESLDMRRGSTAPVALYRLVKKLRRHRSSVVHSHMFHANEICRAARPWSRIPVLVSTIHNTFPGGAWRRYLSRALARYSDVTTVVSEAAADWWRPTRTVPAGRLQVVPNAVEVGGRAPSPEERARMRQELKAEERFLWLAVGRFVREKDYPTLLRALSLLGDHPACPLLVIAGDGETRAEAEAMVEGLGISERVRFLGFRRDVDQLMAGADGYVMSSAWEGLPVALLEASAAGLPVVTTRAGGNGEVVVHGQSGYVVPTGDPAELAAAMARMMGLSSEVRARMGQQGRRRTLTVYSRSRVDDIWDELYRGLLAARGIHVSPERDPPESEPASRGSH